MLKFAIHQWRNVCQKQTVPKDETHSKREREDGDEAKVETTEEHAGGTGSDATVQAPKTLKIRINLKARKVGRPQKQRETTAASERSDRKWFKAAEKSLTTEGVDTLGELLGSLDADKPGLSETHRRLSGVLTKYAHAADQRPVFRKMRNPVRILDPFYILPSTLLDHCMGILPITNAMQNPVHVEPVVDDVVHAGSVVEVVQINNVGSFSREQIDVMKRVDILKSTVQLGVDAHKWLVEEALPELGAEYHEEARQVARKIINTYPYLPIEGLDMASDYVYSMLYRVIPPSRLTDASIKGLYDRLTADFPSCRFGGAQSVAAKSSRARKDGEEMVTKEVLERINAQTDEKDVGTLLLPLTFSNAHWCCIMVKIAAVKTYYYDPLNQKPYTRWLRI